MCWCFCIVVMFLQFLLLRVLGSLPKSCLTETKTVGNDGRRDGGGLGRVCGLLEVMRWLRQEIGVVVCFAFCSLKLMISEEICGRFGRFDVEIDAYRLSREVGVMLMDR